MRKKYLRNVPLYLLTAANAIYAVKNGFSWVTWVAFGLTFIVLVFDVLEMFMNGRK